MLSSDISRPVNQEADPILSKDSNDGSNFIHRKKIVNNYKWNIYRRRLTAKFLII